MHCGLRLKFNSKTNEFLVCFGSLFFHILADSLVFPGATLQKLLKLKKLQDFVAEGGLLSTGLPSPFKQKKLHCRCAINLAY